MTIFEKIEKILIDKRIGINDFVEKTGFPKTSYYALKKGKANSITHKVAYKINDVYPDYTIEWLMDDEEKVQNNTIQEPDPEYKTKKSVSDKDAILIYDNWDAYMNNRIFKAKFESEASIWAFKKFTKSKG